MTSNTSSWVAVGQRPMTTLEDGRLQLHWASQVLMAVGETLLDPAPDDSHTNLGWDRALLGLTSRPVGPSQARATLAFETLTVGIADDGGQRWSLALAGLTLVQVFEALNAAWNDTVGTLDKPIARRDYDMPTHPVAKGQPFRFDDPAAFGELARWYSNAAMVIAEALPEEAVRCWPHHFDIAAGFSLPSDGEGEEGGHIGVGFSPGDDENPGGYWYVEGYPWPEAASGADWKGPTLDPPAHWYSERWGGAMMAPDALADMSADTQLETVKRFIAQGQSGCRELL